MPRIVKRGKVCVKSDMKYCIRRALRDHCKGRNSHEHYIHFMKGLYETMKVKGMEDLYWDSNFKEVVNDELDKWYWGKSPYMKDGDCMGVDVDDKLAYRICDRYNSGDYIEDDWDGGDWD